MTPNFMEVNQSQAGACINSGLVIPIFVQPCLWCRRWKWGLLTECLSVKPQLDLPGNVIGEKNTQHFSF